MLTQYYRYIRMSSVGPPRKDSSVMHPGIPNTPNGSRLISIHATVYRWNDSSEEFDFNQRQPQIVFSQVDNYYLYFYIPGFEVRVKWIFLGNLVKNKQRRNLTIYLFFFNVYKTIWKLSVLTVYMQTKGSWGSIQVANHKKSSLHDWK